MNLVYSSDLCACLCLNACHCVVSRVSELMRRGYCSVFAWRRTPGGRKSC